MFLVSMGIGFSLMGIGLMLVLAYASGLLR